MLKKFDLSVGKFSQDAFTGTWLRTDIVMTKDWPVEVKVDGKIVYTFVKRIVNKKLEIVFRRNIENKRVEITRKAFLENSRLGVVFSYAQADTFLDSLTELIQDRAIERITAATGRFLFGSKGLPSYLSGVTRRSTLTRLYSSIWFLFNKWTAGLISQCPERPKKNDWVEDSIPAQGIDDINLEYSFPLNSFNGIGLVKQDRNSGLKPLAGKLTFIKDIQYVSNTLTIKVFKAYFLGVKKVYQMPRNPLAGGVQFRACIGYLVIPLALQVDRGEWTFTGNVEDLDLASRQNLSIQATGNIFFYNDIETHCMPIMLESYAPEADSLSGCGIESSGSTTTLEEWLR